MSLSGTLQNMRRSVSRRLAPLVVLATLVGTPACGNDELPTIVESGASAGSVGKCIPAEIYPGYSSCLMDQPQNQGTQDSIPQALTSNLPERVDLRSSFDSSCVPVRNQGEFGWCVALSLTSAMGIMESIQGDCSFPSDPHLWYQGGGALDDRLGGWFIERALQTAQRHTLVAQPVWPYSTLHGEMARTQPSDTTLEQLGRYRLANFRTLDKGDVDGIKSALSQQFPVLYSLPVFCDSGWLAIGSSGTIDEQQGTIRLPEAIGDRCTSSSGSFQGCYDAEPGCLAGYHALLIIGYDDSTETFLIRNSWGEGWGDNGYGTISYDYVRSFGRGGGYPWTDFSACTSTSSRYGCSDSSTATIVNDCGVVEETIACELGEHCEEVLGCVPTASDCLPEENIGCVPVEACDPAPGCDTSGCMLSDNFEGDSLDTRCRWVDDATITAGVVLLERETLAARDELVAGCHDFSLVYQGRLNDSSERYTLFLGPSYLRYDGSAHPNMLIFGCSTSGGTSTNYQEGIPITSWNTLHLQRQGENLLLSVNGTLQQTVPCYGGTTSQLNFSTSTGSGTLELDYVTLICDD